MAFQVLRHRGADDQPPNVSEPIFAERGWTVAGMVVLVVGGSPLPCSKLTWQQKMDLVKMYISPIENGDIPLLR